MGEQMGERQAHVIEAVPIVKLRDGVIGYRWRCSCGRERYGIHRTPEKAIAAGTAHTSSPSGEVK